MKKMIVFVFALIMVFSIYNQKTISPIHTNAEENTSIYDGSLILINKQLQVQNTEGNLIEIPRNIQSNVEVRDTYLMDATAITQLEKMFKAAKKDKINHFKINSAFRSPKLQQTLYVENGADYALPAGYSEHQSGYAVDIGSTKGMMGESNEGIWLANNAHKYGFILRYPENKTHITGISYEPWHFRFVGLPHSIIMHNNDLVLEEYIAHLQNGTVFETTIDEKNYVVKYVTENQFTSIIPNDYFHISGDNDKGYIVTAEENSN